MKIQTTIVFGMALLLLSAPYASARSLKSTIIWNGKESVELSVLMDGQFSFGLPESVEPEKIVEEDGFVWYKERVDGCQQIYDGNGNVIIPSSRRYGWGRYMPDWGMFSVWSRSDRRNAAGLPESYYGICLKDGTELISPNRRYTSCRYSKDTRRFTVKKGNYVGICDSTGREMISPDLGYESCRRSRSFYSVSSGTSEGLHDYATGKMIIPVSRGYNVASYNPVRDFINVKKNGLCGICLKDGTEIIPPVWFDCIYNTAVKKFRGKRTLNSMWEDIDLNNPVPHN